jgi:hypothetical protein
MFHILFQLFIFGHAGEPQAGPRPVVASKVSLLQAKGCKAIKI